jgi:hypothetical protein
MRNGSNTIFKVVILEQVEVLESLSIVFRFIVPEKHAHAIEFGIDVFDGADSGHAVLLAHPVLEVTIVLVIIEISYHLEGPRFDLLLFNHLLKHVG